KSHSNILMFPIEFTKLHKTFYPMFSIIDHSFDSNVLLLDEMAEQRTNSP
ncbi:13681_t:CDS:1, partial [Entrophospora sp. SA101]